MKLFPTHLKRQKIYLNSNKTGYLHQSTVSIVLDLVSYDGFIIFHYRKGLNSVGFDSFRLIRKAYNTVKVPFKAGLEYNNILVYVSKTPEGEDISTEVLTFEVISSSICSKNPVLIRWLNNLGGFDSYLFLENNSQAFRVQDKENYIGSDQRITLTRSLITQKTLRLTNRAATSSEMLAYERLLGSRVVYLDDFQGVFAAFRPLPENKFIRVSVNSDSLNVNTKEGAYVFNLDVTLPKINHI